MKSSFSFNYSGGDRTMESVVRRAQRAGRGFDSYVRGEFTMWKPKEGENCIRILPETWSSEELWGKAKARDNVKRWQKHWDIPIFVHYSVGPDNAAYLCPDKMMGEPCPICDMRRKTDDEDEKRQMRASERRLVWIIDRSNEKAGPQVWPMPSTLCSDILGRTIDRRAGSKEPIRIDHPDEGFDVIFVREGSGITTKYVQVEVLRDSTPIHTKADRGQAWLDYIAANPLPDVLEYYDAAYIKKVLFGQKADDEEEVVVEEETEEVTPPRPRVRVKDDDAPPPRARFRAGDPEDEDEEEEDKEAEEDDEEDDEDEEADEDKQAEEAPRPSIRTRRGREPNGGDAEEDTPPKRRAPPVPARPSGTRLSGLRQRR